MKRGIRDRLAGKGGVIALALLVCGMVFAAVAAPAQSLHTRTQAFQQTAADLAAPTKTIQATIEYSSMLSDLAMSGASVDETVLSQSEQEILGSLPLVPLVAGDTFTSVASSGQEVSSGYGPLVANALTPKLVFNYRDTLAANSRLVTGSLAPGPGFPPGALAVTGIITPVHPDSVFWQLDVTAMVPAENNPRRAPRWIGEVFADPGQLVTMDSMFGTFSQVTWVYPVQLAGINADQVQGLYDQLNQVNALAASVPALGPDIGVLSPLAAPLQAFLQTQSAVLAVLLLLFVSLGAIGVAVTFLAARMIVDRRRDELIMLRARGASSRQVAVALARSSALAMVPVAVIGTALAIAIVPGAGRAAGGSAPLSWKLVAAIIVIAVVFPPVIAVWRHRQPAPAANPARIMTADTRTARVSPRVLRRIVADLTAGGR